MLSSCSMSRLPSARLKWRQNPNTKPDATATPSSFARGEKRGRERFQMQISLKKRARKYKRDKKIFSMLPRCETPEIAIIILAAAGRGRARADA